MPEQIQFFIKPHKNIPEEKREKLNCLLVGLKESYTNFLLYRLDMVENLKYEYSKNCPKYGVYHPQITIEMEHLETFDFLCKLIKVLNEENKLFFIGDVKPYKGKQSDFCKRSEKLAINGVYEVPIERSLMALNDYAIKCNCCDESYGLHLENVTVFQDTKTYTNHENEAVNLIIEAIGNRRGSAIVTTYWCEHCDNILLYNLEYFHKGSVYNHMFVQEFAFKAPYEELWRD